MSELQSLKQLPGGFYRLDQGYQEWIKIVRGYLPSELVQDTQNSFREIFLNAALSHYGKFALVDADQSKEAPPLNRWTEPTFPFSMVALKNSTGIPFEMDGKSICIPIEVVNDIARPQLRDDLIEHLRYGRIKLKDALEIFKKAGYQNLQGTPVPLDYDPMTINFWSPIMTLAWIVWRHETKVRDFWWKYVEHCKYFFPVQFRTEEDGQIIQGQELRSSDRPTKTLLVATARHHEKKVAAGQLIENKITMHCSVGVALSELWRQLETGDLKATGILQSSRQAIEAHLWQDLELGDDENRPEYVQPKGNNNPNSHWTSVTMPYKLVLELWPLPPSPNSNLNVEPTTKPPRISEPDWSANSNDTSRILPESSKPVRKQAPQQEIDHKFKEYSSSLVGETTTRDDTRIWAKLTFGDRITQKKADEMDAILAVKQNRKTGPSRKSQTPRAKSR